MLAPENNIIGNNNPPFNMRFPNNFGNRMTTQVNEEFIIKNKEDSIQPNLPNTGNAESMLNVNNMGLNFINTNANYGKAPGMGNNVNLNGNNKLPFQNNSLPHNQFNQNNQMRYPLQMMSVPPFLPNGMMRPNGNMGFQNNMQINKNVIQGVPGMNNINMNDG